MSDQTEKKERAIRLAEDSLVFGGLQLTYRLRVMAGEPTGEYRISVSLPEESAEVSAGGSLTFALEAYQTVMDGRVTPCALGEVMSDLFYTDTKLKKSLYNASSL